MSTLVVLAALTLLLATVLSWRRDWRLALLANFRAHLVMAALALAILAALLGEVVLLLALLVIAAINLFDVLRPTRPSREVIEGRAVRLAFANLLETNVTPDPVLDWVGSERPDLFVCAEAHRHWRFALKTLEGDFPFVAGSSQGDVMIFARQPFEVEPIEIFATIGHAVVARIDGLTVVGLHTASPETQLRSDSLDDLLAKVAAVLRTTTGPVVVVGDFNATPWTRPVRRLMQETGLRCAPGALAGTFPAQLFGWTIPGWFALPIDIVLVGRGAKASSRRRGPLIGSDHWPVLAELVHAKKPEKPLPDAA